MDRIKIHIDKAHDDYITSRTNPNFFHNEYLSSHWYGWFNEKYFEIVEDNWDFKIIWPMLKDGIDPTNEWGDFGLAYAPSTWKSISDTSKCIMDFSWEGCDLTHQPFSNSDGTLSHYNIREFLPDNVIPLNGNQNDNLYINNTFSFVNKFKTNEIPPKKEKFGICLNRIVKEHRTAVIEFLKDKNYIDDFIWSYDVVEEIHDARQHAPFNGFSKAYFFICTESIFSDEYNPKFITEKIMKGIYHKNIFIMVGPLHGIQALRDLGFDTFDDIIDHSYDLVIDRFDRLDKCLEVIDNIMNRKEEIIELYNTNDIQDRLEYNKNKVLELPEQHTKDVYNKLKLL